MTTSSHLTALLSAPHTPATAALKALNDPALYGLLEADDVAGLLGHWGAKVLYSSAEKDQPDLKVVIERLMEMGANPWKVEGLVSKWVDANQVKWVARAMEFSTEQRTAFPRDWLRVAIEKDQFELVQLLIDNGANMQDPAAKVLFSANSPAMVELLCRRGADMHKIDIVGHTPLRSWLEKAATKDDQLIKAAKLATAAASTYLALGRDLSGRGFELLPFIASLMDARKARVYGRMADSGFEAIGIKHQVLTGVLSGWAWSVLCSGFTAPSIRDSASLVQECLLQKDGTLDDEWFYAAAAADMLGHKSGRSIGRLAHFISQRIEQLQSLPSLSPERPDNTRWDDVLERAGSAALSPYQPSTFLPALSKAALKQVLNCLLQGRSLPASIGPLQRMNELAVKARRNSNEFVKELTRATWASGIPESFWESQDYKCPAWFTAADPKTVISHFTRRAQSGERVPEGVEPSFQWPDEVKSWLQSSELALKTTPATSSLRPRRM